MNPSAWTAPLLRRALAPADSLGQRPQAAHFRRRQRVGEDDIAVALEAVEVGGIGWHASGYGRPAVRRPRTGVTAPVTLLHLSCSRWAVAV